MDVPARDGHGDLLSPQGERRDGLLALLLLGPVILGSVFSLGALTLETRDVPRDEDYRPLAEALRQSGFDPKVDRLAILPAWSLRPLVTLKAFPWISGDHLWERPLHRVRDLYVVKEPDGEGALHALRGRLGVGERLAPAESFPTGRVELYRFETGGRTVKDDLGERIHGAEVRLVKGTETTTCTTRRANGWGCPGRKDWQRVTRQRLLVSENGEVALWAHPAPAGEVLEVTWPDAQLGDVLVVEAGPTRTGASWGKAPVRVRVMVGGELVASFERDQTFRYRAELIDTSRVAGTTAPVTVAIDTRDNGKNHFAFDVYTASAP